MVQISCHQHTGNQGLSPQKNQVVVRDTVYKNNSDNIYAFCRTHNGDSLLAIKKNGHTRLLKVYKKSAVDTLYNQKEDYDSAENISIIEDFNIFNEKALIVYRNTYRSGFMVLILEKNTWRKIYASDINMYPQYGVVQQDLNVKTEPFNAEIVSNNQIKLNDFGQKYTLNIDLENRKFTKTAERE